MFKYYKEDSRLNFYFIFIFILIFYFIILKVYERRYMSFCDFLFLKNKF